ncbi:MAG: hypothetical protein ACXIUV_13440 [Alkalilacustris sp.]
MHHPRDLAPAVLVGALSALCLTAIGAQASSVTPTFDEFGQLSAATFGGSGIPNDNVAISRLTVGEQTLTLGLTAHQRFASPALTNDGAGTFFARPGNATLNDGSSDNTAAWNFAWYASVNTGSISDFDIKLYWDIDPGVGTPILELGSVGVPGEFCWWGCFSVQPSSEGSQNLSFNLFPFENQTKQSPDFSGGFDQFALGEYSFLMTASRDGHETSVGINVNVIPVPAALPLLAGGISLLGLMGWRRRRAA